LKRKGKTIFGGFFFLFQNLSLLNRTVALTSSRETFSIGEEERKNLFGRGGSERLFFEKRRVKSPGKKGRKTVAALEGEKRILSIAGKRRRFFGLFARGGIQEGKKGVAYTRREGEKRSFYRKTPYMEGGEGRA